MLPSFILMFCTASVSEKNKTAHMPTDSKKSMIVLELFTSQGCSSCPPADRLLGKYANDENVIALSFHVDYWDRLGWKDPFSNTAFSQRQKDYAKVFKSGSIYTPQLIINGEREMIGSDADKISKALEVTAKQAPISNINIDSVQVGNNKATINYTIRGSEKNVNLNIALVQTEVTTSIKAGENSGLNLTNYNVVRYFTSIPSIIDGTNIATINLPQGAEKKDYSVVAFLQNSQTHKISSAIKSVL